MISYTLYLQEIDEGRSPNLPAPAIARHYWKLADDATLRDVVLVVRADEAHHRDVNHGFASELAGIEPAATVAPTPNMPTNFAPRPEPHSAQRQDKRMRTASAHAMTIVKATAPALEKHGLAITTAMYARLFENKDIETMFDRAAQTSGEQPKRLAAAILAYAKNIDRLQNLGPAVSRMVGRHIETGVKAEHYPYVANALLPRDPRRAGRRDRDRRGARSVGRGLLDACRHPHRRRGAGVEDAEAA